jgi:hypothetical protein
VNMRPFLLISMNFAKEQMWPLFFLLLWVLGWVAFGLFADLHNSSDDALLIFRQLGVYAVAFAAFFGSSAISADLRSRRILAVLSKAVSRFQYLGGLLAGIGMILGIFCLCTGFTASWLLGRFGYGLGALWFGILALFTACLLTALVTLLFSTFLPPLFAAIGSGILAGIPALLTMQGSTVARYVIPVYGLLEPMMVAHPNTAWHGKVVMVLVGLAESATLLLIATWIFSRRDLAVAIE